MSAKPFDTLIMFLKEHFENVNFERQQKYEKSLSMLRVLKKNLNIYQITLGIYRLKLKLTGNRSHVI